MNLRCEPVDVSFTSFRGSRNRLEREWALLRRAVEAAAPTEVYLVPGLAWTLLLDVVAVDALNDSRLATYDPGTYFPGNVLLL